MIEKKLFTICFLIALFIYSGLSIYNTVPVIQWDLTHQELDDEDTSAKLVDKVNNNKQIVENDISEKIYGRYECIETYGQIIRSLGKTEVNGFTFAIDKTNSYEPINFWSEANDIPFRTYAQQLVMFRDAIEENGGHFAFILFPHKLTKDWNTGFEGIPYNDFNEQADRLLHWLDFYGVDYIDFRETLKKSGLEYDEMFYRTDHHWTGNAAFLAFKDLVEFMNDKYDANLDPTGYYRDESNYSFEWMEKCFLGSQGRNVGAKFSGKDLEDFMVVKPLFETNYNWTYLHDDTVRNSLLDVESLSYDNIYKSNMYEYYLHGVNSRDNIENLDNPDGPSVYMVRDSYASPLMIDLAPLCSRLDASWGKYSSDRHVKDDIVPGNYDYVFVAYYPEDLTDEFFKFYKEDVEEYKLEYAKSQGYMKEDE